MSWILGALVCVGFVIANHEFVFAHLVSVRVGLALLSVMLSAGAIVVSRKRLRSSLYLEHDMDLQGAFALFMRWFPIGLWPPLMALSLLGDWQYWFSSSYLFFYQVGLFFFICKPPDMDLRMRNGLGGESRLVR